MTKSNKLINQLNFSKKLRAALLFIMVLLLPSGAWAEDYPFTIGGVQITDANIGTGTYEHVSYNKTNYTITLSGVTNLPQILWKESHDLTIAIEGTNNIQGNPQDSATHIRAEYNTAKLIFKKSGSGSASLYMHQYDQGDNAPSIISGFESINFDGLYLKSNVPTKYANKTIAPYDPGANANVTIKSLISALDDYCIHEATITSKETYQIWVAGTQVDADNQGDVLNNAAVSFEPSDNTLTLNGITLANTYGGNYIVSNMPTLKVDLHAPNIIYCTGAAIKNLYTGASLDFKTTDTDLAYLNVYTGKLYDGFSDSDVTYEEGMEYDLTSDPNYVGEIYYDLRVGKEDKFVLYKNKDNFTVDDGTIVFGQNGGKVSYEPTTHTLTIENATITGCGIKWSEAANLNIKLIGTNTITIPSGSTNRCIKFDGQTAAPTLSFERGSQDCLLTMNCDDYPIDGFSNATSRDFGDFFVIDGTSASTYCRILVYDYKIKVDGTDVTSRNASNVLNDATASVSYEAATNTLKLNNARLGQGVFTSLADLTIREEGDNDWITSGNGNCIASTANTGTLTFEKATGAKLVLNTASYSHYSIIRGFQTLAGVSLETQEPYEILSDNYYRLKDKLATDSAGLQYAIIEADNVYPLWFGSQQLTSKGVRNGSGDATYDASTNTVTLSDGFEVVVTGNDAKPLYTILNDINNLNINLSGSSTLYCKGPKDYCVMNLGNAPDIKFTTDAANPGKLTLLALDDKNWFGGNCTPDYKNGLMRIDGEKNGNYFTSTITWFFEGAGTESSPFLINNSDELKKLASYINDGTLTTQHFKLTANLDLASVSSFDQIGNYRPFRGTFDGSGKTISGLKHEVTFTTEAIGLFGYIGDATTAGTVKNLKLQNCTFSGGDGNIGAIVGSLVNGTIDNCIVSSCNVSREDVMSIYAGGIAGNITTGTIKNCIVDGTTNITAKADDGGTAQAGAIYGGSNGAAAPTLTDNYYYYTVKATTKVGSADAVEKKDYTERGIGNAADKDGALLYTQPVTFQGLSQAAGDTYGFASYYAPKTDTANDIYHLAPASTATLNLTPRPDNIPNAVTLTYTPAGGTEKTDNLDNKSTTGGYTYEFSMPDAAAKVGVTFDVDLSSNSFTYETNSNTYNGTAVEPTVSMKKGTTDITPFAKDAQYTIEGYQDENHNAISGAPVNAGTYYVVIKGKANSGYTGTKEVQFTIGQADLAGVSITAIADQTFTGAEIKPTVAATFNSKPVADTEYDVAYTNNINVGDATVTLTAKGVNFTRGTKQTASFKITANTGALTVTPATTTYTYDGTAKEPAVTVTSGTTTLTLTTDYTVTYSENTNAGTANIKVTGVGNYAGATGTATFTINPKDLTADMVTLSKEDFDYDGTVHKPDVTVKDGTLLTTNDYDVTNDGGKDPGTYQVVVTGKNNYKGTVTKTFTITSQIVRYPIKVGSTEITELNLTDVFGTYDQTNNVAASVSYNPNSNELFLSSTTGNMDVEYWGSEDLIVYLVPNTENTLGKIVYTGKNDVQLTFTADGNHPCKLTLETNNGNVIEGFNSLGMEYNLLVLPEAGSEDIGYEGKRLPVQQATIGRGINPIITGTSYTPEPEDFTHKDSEGNEVDNDLSNTNINDFLFTLNISNDDGYNTADKSIVLNTVVTQEDLDNAAQFTPGSNAYAEAYTGITFELAAGTGVIKIDAETYDGYLLGVQIGTDAPYLLDMTRGEIFTIDYDVDEPTLVRIFNAGKSTAAREKIVRPGKRTVGHIKVFNVTVSPKSVSAANPVQQAAEGHYLGETPEVGQDVNAPSIISGIETLEAPAKISNRSDKWYNLNGQQIDKPTKSGLYIHNGEKIFIK